jgi:hypothetical protein
MTVLLQNVQCWHLCVDADSDALLACLSDAIHVIPLGGGTGAGSGGGLVGTRNAHGGGGGGLGVGQRVGSQELKGFSLLRTATTNGLLALQCRCCKPVRVVCC